PPAQNTTHAVLAKYDADGNALDAASHDAPNGFASFGAVTVDGSGRYVAVGEADGDFLVARVTADMQPDVSFNPDGFVVTDFGTGFSDAAFATKVLNSGNGKIIVAGSSNTPSEQTLPAIARYLGVASASSGGGGGNDTFTVTGDVKTPLLIDGGACNDVINGGKGNDILLGGADNDVLTGHEGRDILIGGTGSDNLIGTQDEDILIAGTTTHDGRETALNA